MKSATLHVLFGHRDSTLIDNIYHRSRLCDILSMCKTCTDGQIAWKNYCARTFNMNRMLSKYFLSHSAFRRLLHSTGSIIIGPCVTSFLHRVPAGRIPMDIMTDRAHAKAIISFIQEREYYSQWGWEETIAEYVKRNTQEIGVREVRRSGLRSAIVPVKIAQQREICVGGVFTFSRERSDGVQQHVRVLIARTCITKSVLTMSTSKRSQYFKIAI